MFHCRVNEQTELCLIELEHSQKLTNLFELNREHLRRWHAWMDLLCSVHDVEKAIVAWQQQNAGNLGFHAGIWFRGQLCGMISHIHVDWRNRNAALSYWLDSAHQGRGIMTSCCRAIILHGFNSWNLNRITIECATDNTRSRAIPERLGFKLEGITRSSEWLHDHFADHAIYGLLKSDWGNSDATPLPRE
jgi:ribosomal-protein-serine acetyltransferase